MTDSRSPYTSPLNLLGCTRPGHHRSFASYSKREVYSKSIWKEYLRIRQYEEISNPKAWSLQLVQSLTGSGDVSKVRFTSASAPSAERGLDRLTWYVIGRLNFSKLEKGFSGRPKIDAVFHVSCYVSEFRWSPRFVCSICFILVIERLNQKTFFKEPENLVLIFSCAAWTNWKNIRRVYHVFVFIS